MRSCPRRSRARSRGDVTNRRRRPATRATTTAVPSAPVDVPSQEGGREFLRKSRPVTAIHTTSPTMTIIPMTQMYAIHAGPSPADGRLGGTVGWTDPDTVQITVRSAEAITAAS